MQAVGTVEMARMLDTTPETVRSMWHAGDISAMRVGRVLKFSPETVFAELNQKKEREQQAGRSRRAVGARRKVF